MKILPFLFLLILTSCSDTCKNEEGDGEESLLGDIGACKVYEVKKVTKTVAPNGLVICEPESILVAHCRDNGKTLGSED